MRIIEDVLLCYVGEDRHDPLATDEYLRRNDYIVVATFNRDVYEAWRVLEGVADTPAARRNWAIEAKIAEYGPHSPPEVLANLLALRLGHGVS